MVRFLERVFDPSVLSSDTTVTLHDRVSSDLGKKFAGAMSVESGDTGADLILRSGDGVTVIEVKTGDPDRRLPSSASAQMRKLAEQAKRMFENVGVKNVRPVLVTNYKMNETDKEELEKFGIKFISLAPTLSLYDADQLTREVANVAGLDESTETEK
jgi:hypothetical protein